MIFDNQIDAAQYVVNHLLMQSWEQSREVVEVVKKDDEPLTARIILSNGDTITVTGLLAQKLLAFDEVPSREALPSRKEVLRENR